MTSTITPVRGAAEPRTAQRVRVAIVDEYPAHVEGVARAIADSSSMEVVMVASSGRDALAQIEQVGPDVVILEPWMRTGDGLALASILQRDHPEITVVALSRMWDDAHVAETMSAGIGTHLPKTTPLHDLPALVRQAARGAEMRPATNGHTGGRSPLTAREREVLRLAARGMSNAEIGRELFVSEQTVKFHLANTYRKLGVHNRTQASHEAARAGILG